MWKLPKRRVSRTVVVIKQQEQLYVVKSSFFARRLGLVRDDHNCPRSKHNDLIQKVAMNLISVPSNIVSEAQLWVSEEPYQMHGVVLEGEGKRIDLNVYFIHTDERCNILFGKHCVKLKGHRLDRLLLDRARRSRIKVREETTTEAA